MTGNGYAATGIFLPLQLAPGQALTFSIRFSPAVAGTAPGAIVLKTNAQNSQLAIPLTGVGNGLLQTIPTGAGFGNVPIGIQNTQTIAVVNTTGRIVEITQVAAHGTGFVAGDIDLPTWMNPGDTAYFLVAFQPASTGNYSASVTVTSTAPNTSVTIPLVGIGVAPTRILSIYPSNLQFYNVDVNASVVQEIQLQSLGNSYLTISADSLKGTGYAANILNGVTLAPWESTTVSVQFTPPATGTSNGALTITSNATNGSSVVVPLTGTGIAGHAVTLRWQPSNSPGVIGYYVYRANASDGSFQRLGGTQLASFSDTSTFSKTEYFYVVTALNESYVESSPSNEVAVTVP